MKMKNIYLLVLALGVLVSSCELPDNVDPKAATEVPVETLMTNALVSGLALVDNMSQNTNVSRFLCQYNSQVQYTEPSRYFFSDRQIPDGFWNTAYLTLRDLMEVKTILSELPDGSDAFNRSKANKIATVDIMEVLLYQNLVDFFGDVPYTEALGGADNKTPAYNDARTIYDDLQARLSADISTLSAGSGDGSWGSEDVVFGGDVDLWRKTAATLKLRMGVRLAATDAGAAQTHINDAVAAGCLEAGEYMQLPWIGVSPHVNTIYRLFIVDNRNDYAPSKTIIDIMEALGDARMPVYFTQVEGAYVGLPYGLIGNEQYSAYSHFSDVMFAADFPATITGNDEVRFCLAEAAARGLTVTGSAQEHYEAGIAESHAHWGVTYDAATYLAQADVAWDDARNKELIGIQKWIALYNRGNEGWATFRIFDWPVLTPPEEMSYTDIPMRMPYPYNEPDLNGDNYAAAASAIGGDDVRTLLFWDDAISTETPSAAF